VSKRRFRLPGGGGNSRSGKGLRPRCAGVQSAPGLPPPRHRASLQILDVLGAGRRAERPGAATRPGPREPTQGQLGARRSFAHVPLASPQASPSSGVLLGKGGSPGGRMHTPLLPSREGSRPPFTKSPPTTSTGGWSASSSRFPDHSQRPLAERNRVAWRPVRNSARQRGRVSSCAVDRLEPEQNPAIRSSYPPGAGRHARKNRPTGKFRTGTPGNTKGRPFTGVGERPGPVSMTSKPAPVFPSI
jgi:hypothetical protein